MRVQAEWIIRPQGRESAAARDAVKVKSLFRVVEQSPSIASGSDSRGAKGDEATNTLRFLQFRLLQRQLRHNKIQKHTRLLWHTRA
jgi:hypothetical protein